MVHSESVAGDRDYKLSEATLETTLGDDEAEMEMSTMTQKTKRTKRIVVEMA